MTDRQEFAQRLYQARAEGRQAVAMLAEQHLPLVAMLVGRFPLRGREPEELYQQGCVGLMKALARYDPDYGVTFSTYAAAMILGEMRMLARLDAPMHIPRRDRELRQRIHRTQRMLTASLGREPTVQEVATALRTEPAELVLAMEEIRVVPLEQPLSPQGGTLLDRLSAEDGWMDRLLLRDMIARLPREDQRLLLLRYHLGKTQAETARTLGMTQVQVSRRESAIKATLRQNWQEE